MIRDQAARYSYIHRPRLMDAFIFDGLITVKRLSAFPLDTPEKFFA